MKILELVAATGNWIASYEGETKPKHVACWALIEESRQIHVVGMIHIPDSGAALDPADNVAGFVAYKKAGK